MLCPIAANRKRIPHALALATDELRLTYEELDEGVASFCAELDALEVGRGSRVAFVATPSWKTALLFFALFRLGAVACPISFRLPESGVANLRDELAPDLFLEPASLHRGKAKLLLEEIDEHALAVLMATSGSSGTSKIVALSFQNLYLSAVGSMEKLPLIEEDRLLLSLPLFHIGGLSILMRAFYAGLTVCLSSLPLYDAIVHHQIDFLSLVPTQLYRLLQHPTPPVLKGVLLGGAALSSQLLKNAQAKGHPIFTSYGMTEMSSQVTLDLAPEMRSSGFVLPHRELTILEGEICVRGDTLFQGYWNKTSGLSLPLDAEGWFHTKDRGIYGEKGELIVLGRIDSLFISGGENIYPEEIEAALLSLPDILEAVVVPIPDVEFGERPAAFIASEKGFSEEKILQKLKKSLPGFKVPRRIYPLPPEESLKRNRLKLREMVQNLS